MHNCKTTRSSLIDLALDELQASTNPPASTGGSYKSARLLAELEECSACRAEYASLRRTLGVVVQSTRSAAPAESFWSGYHSRLSQRIKSPAETEQIADVFQPRLPARLWSTLKKIAGTSVRIPVRAVAVLPLFFGL